ncbi:MAG: type II toxin-antitoxin system RelE family toxin [Thermoplasmatota archaeon]
MRRSYELSDKDQKRAIKEMKVLSNEVQIRIKEKVRSVLGENPYPTGNNDVKKILGSQFWRLRVGDHRVFFDIDEEGKIVYILSIRHRSKAYREL